MWRCHPESFVPQDKLRERSRLGQGESLRGVSLFVALRVGSLDSRGVGDKPRGSARSEDPGCVILVLEAILEKTSPCEPLKGKGELQICG
jgi:hypothetical protein